MPKKLSPGGRIKNRLGLYEVEPCYKCGSIPSVGSLPFISADYQTAFCTGCDFRSPSATSFEDAIQNWNQANELMRCAKEIFDG